MDRAMELLAGHRMMVFGTLTYRYPYTISDISSRREKGLGASYCLHIHSFSQASHDLFDSCFKVGPSRFARSVSMIPHKP